MTSDNTSSIDAVLPLTLADIDRAWILLRSLEFFGEAIRILWVVAPDKDLETIRRKCGSRLNLRFVADGELLPLWSRMTAISRYSPFLAKFLYGRGMRGWYVQQLIKLAIVDRVETSFYLVLDADMFLIRPLRSGDLIRDGKGIWQRGKTTGLAEWNKWASRVIGVPDSLWVSGVTPALLNRDAVAKLLSFLGTERLSETERMFGRMMGFPPSLDWQLCLMRRLPWTEYALYLTYLEARGCFEHYHWDAGDVGLYDNSFSVWTDDDWDRWNPDVAFSEANKGWFVVVQNFLRPSSVEIWAKLHQNLSR